MGLGLIVDILVLFGLLAMASIALKKGELPDLKCPQGPYTIDKTQCREGNGKSYAGSQPSSNDPIDTLLKKIGIAATASRKDILWRRCFLPAVAATLCVFGLVLRRFPHWFELLSVTFFIMMPIYFMQTFYSHHHYAHIEKNIQTSLSLLQDRFRDLSESNDHLTSPKHKSSISPDIIPHDRLPKSHIPKGHSESGSHLTSHKNNEQDQKSHTQAKLRRSMKKPTYD